jgi:deoxyribose-phosphate aldolase
MHRDELAALIDHTLLKPEATVGEVEALCAEATELRVAAVCVSPSLLPLSAPPGPGIGIASVVGFPSGAHRSRTKAAEAAQAVADGATELDMVVALGAAKAQRWDEVGADIASVVDAAGLVPVKVIIESAALTDDEVILACAAAEAHGAAYVKTSTGFHPAGGASEAAVRLMARAVGGRLGVKASGGIRDTSTALRLVEAGATRLGCSATKAILAGL